MQKIKIKTKNEKKKINLEFFSLFVFSVEIEFNGKAGHFFHSPSRYQSTVILQGPFIENQFIISEEILQLELFLKIRSTNKLKDSMKTSK